MFNNLLPIPIDLIKTLSDISHMVEPLVVVKFISALEREPVYLLEYKVNILRIFLKSRILNFDDNERVNDYLNLFNIYLLKEYPFWNVEFLMKHGFVDLADEVLQQRYIAINLLLDLLLSIPEFSKNPLNRINVFSIIINSVVF